MSTNTEPENREHHGKTSNTDNEYPNSSTTLVPGYELDEHSHTPFSLCSPSSEILKTDNTLIKINGQKIQMQTVVLKVPKQVTEFTAPR